MHNFVVFPLSMGNKYNAKWQDEDLSLFAILISKTIGSAWKANTISNPVNTRVTRMCGDYDILFYILPGGQYIVEVA